MKLSTAHKIGRFFQYFVLILVGVIMIYPLVWICLLYTSIPHRRLQVKRVIVGPAVHRQANIAHGSFDSVSYTHLDVYKRQSVKCIPVCCSMAVATASRRPLPVAVHLTVLPPLVTTTFAVMLPSEFWMKCASGTLSGWVWLR